MKFNKPDNYYVINSDIELLISQNPELRPLNYYAIYSLWVVFSQEEYSASYLTVSGTSLTIFRDWLLREE